MSEAVRAMPVAIGFGVAMGILIIVAAVTRERSPQATPVPRQNPGEVKTLWDVGVLLRRDPETGCEYLRDNGRLWPRMSYDGRTQLCRGGTR